MRSSGAPATSGTSCWRCSPSYSTTPQGPAAWRRETLTGSGARVLHLKGSSCRRRWLGRRLRQATLSSRSGASARHKCGRRVCGQRVGVRDGRTLPATRHPRCGSVWAGANRPRGVHPLLKHCNWSWRTHPHSIGCNNCRTPSLAYPPTSVMYFFANHTHAPTQTKTQ